MSEWHAVQMIADAGPPMRATVTVGSPMGVVRGSIVRIGGSAMFAKPSDPLYYVDSVDVSGCTMTLVRLDPVRRLRSIVGVWSWRVRRVWWRVVLAVTPDA